MNTDLTFITNEPNRTLLERFKELIPNYTNNLDILVGYFFVSGFYKLYKSLENVEKIRILIGIGTDKKITMLANTTGEQLDFDNSSIKKLRDEISKILSNEVANSEDLKEVEDGIKKFVRWVENKKMEIKVYDKALIHAKLYILTFKNYPDKGRVITGSSNFSSGGLVDNLEFNVELKNRTDYEYALKKFNQLWAQSIDITNTFRLFFKIMLIYEHTFANIVIN